MLIRNRVGSTATEQEIQRELDYLYNRLHTINNLIRSLEAYDLHRPKPAQIPREKTA